MKILLFGILLSIQVYAQSFTIKAKWSCFDVYENRGVISLNETKLINAKVNFSKDSYDFYPDIFNDFVDTGFPKVNSKSCLKRFLSSINQSLDKSNLSCIDCDISEIKEKIKLKALNSKYFKNQKTLRLARVYSGHEYISSYVNIQAYCEERKVTQSELVRLIGEKSLKSLNARALNISCLNKLSKLIKNFQIKNLNCDFEICKKISDKNEFLDQILDEIKNEIDIKEMKKKNDLLIDYGFQIANKDIGDIIQNKALYKSENGNCRYYTLVGGKNIFYFDKSIEKFIDTKLKYFDEFCRKNFLKRYIKSKEDLRIKGACLTDKCKEFEDIYYNNIYKIVSLKVHKDVIQHYCQNYVSGKQLNSKNLDDFWQEVLEVNKCITPKIGEEIIHENIIENINNRPTIILNHHHSIKKISENEYQSTLAIEFDEENEEIKNNMINKVNKCVDEANSYFKSPSGQSLKIKLITNEENQKRKKQLDLVNIGISDRPFFRSHSKKYSRTINCATIIHELLHLMGLKDEYRESDSAGKRIVFYDEEKELAFSEEELKELGLNREGFKSKVAYDDCRAHSETLSIMSDDDETYKKVITNKEEGFTSLLHAAHFEKILGGSCKTKAKSYSQCAKFSNKKVYFQCKDRPKFCDDEKRWLLSTD